MDIGVAFPASTTLAEDVRLAEALGYTHAWVDDSQMLFSDPYVSLALCAAQTETIALGVGVTNPSTRIAAVTANAIGTINRLAPGRARLGIGTGNTALRAMGLPAASVADLRGYVDALHGLLAADAAPGDSAGEGEDRNLRFLDPDGGWIDISTRIPVFVAGSGPRVLELAGGRGDGIILFGTVDPDLLQSALARVRRGAERAGRDADALPVMCMTAFCVLQPGEAATSSRALEMIGPFVSSAANLLALSTPDPKEIPSHLRDDILTFRDVFQKPQAVNQSGYSGYATGVRADVRAKMTDAMIRATTLTGSQREIRERLRAMEECGVSMVAIRPVVDVQGTMRSFAQVALDARPPGRL